MQSSFSHMGNPTCMALNESCYRKRQQLVITQECEYCFRWGQSPPCIGIRLTSYRTLKSTTGCDVTNTQCQKRDYVLRKSLGHPVLDPVMYAFIPGLPRVYELKRGYCIFPEQFRDVRSAGLCLTPLTAKSERQKGDYLPPIYIAKVSKDALNAEPAPVPGVFEKSPYLLGPQWNMCPSQALQHNLRILRERLGVPLPLSPTSESQCPCETQFTVYPDPLPPNRSRQNYEAYIFQFPGAPPVDEKGACNPTPLAEVPEANAGGSDEV